MTIKRDTAKADDLKLITDEATGVGASFVEATTAMGYKTIKEQRDEEKRTALLWLFIASRGLLPDFTDFYKLHHSQSLAEIDREFKILLNKNDNGNNL